jgi:hypothetical protein
LLLGPAVGMPFRQQVLVATPNADEGEALSAWLDGEAFEPLSKPTLASASDAVALQPFDLAIIDASFVLYGGLRPFGLARFRETPVIVLGDAADSRACAPFGTQIMFLERPIDRVTFICTVTMALMEARADRRSPRRAVRPFEATVNGVKSYIIDVSREGVRLELPRGRRMVTPQFALRVPLVGPARVGAGSASRGERRRDVVRGPVGQEHRAGRPGLAAVHRHGCVPGAARLARPPTPTFNRSLRHHSYAMSLAVTDIQDSARIDQDAVRPSKRAVKGI